MQATHAHKSDSPAAIRRGLAAEPFAQALRQDQPPAAVRAVNAREHLFFEGDPRHCVFEVVSGSIALFRVLPDGRRQITRFALPGDFLCIGWERLEPCGAEATADSMVKCWPALLARRVAKDAPSSLDWIGAQLAEEAQAMQELARLVSLGGALERVAGFVLRLCDRIGTEQAPAVVALPMTRADIGDHLGLTLETVSRELSRLRRMRIIEIERATQLTILDPVRLRCLGGVFLA